jgi:hypothetical protein
MRTVEGGRGREAGRRRGWCHACGFRRSDPRTRTCHPGGDQFHHGDRGSDAGRGLRLAQPQVRHDGRQPGIRGSCHRQRRGRARQRQGEPGPLLGAPRRQRQLRRGHAVSSSVFTRSARIS